MIRRKQRQRWSSSTLTARISKRALVVPLAAEDAGAGCLLPEEVDLEAVVLRGEDERVIDVQQNPGA